MSSPQDDRPNQDPSKDSSTPNPSQYFHAPHTAPPNLPPETYNYLIHALLSLQGSASHPYPQNYLPTYPHSGPLDPLPYGYPWPPNIFPPISSGPIAGPSSFYPTNPPIAPLTGPQASSAEPPVTSPTASVSSAPDPEDTAPIAEEKRRRNTAASARFRIKKKLKTLNLERTVADLTGRTEELEREATDLRRENAWLKEIVLLKGRNLASQEPRPGNQHDQDEEDHTHTESESESESTAKQKGKGKGKGKARES